MGRLNFCSNNLSNCVKPALRVVITDASEYVARSLAYRIFSEDIFEPDCEIVLSLFDENDLFLESLAIEITACAPVLLKDVLHSNEPSLAFKDADIVFAIGTARDYNFAVNDPSKDPFFCDFVLKTKSNALAIEAYAKRSAKIFTLSNTAARIIAEYAPTIPRENITAVTLALEKFAAYAIGTKIGQLPSDIKNLLIWGANSREVFPSCDNARLNDEKLTPAAELIADDSWCKRELPKLLGSTFHKCRYRVSEALALAEHCKWLIRGTPDNEWTCMGVASDGSYGVPKGVYFSFPVRCQLGNWQIVQGLYVDDYCLRIIKDILAALDERHKAAIRICQQPPPKRVSTRSYRASIIKWK